jgi:hypothetical protein
MNYPMNPLADVMGMPNIMAQGTLLGTMMSPEYFNLLATPYIEAAMQDLGARNILGPSSYGEGMMQGMLGNLWAQNLNNVVGGYQALTPQLSQYAQVYQQPYQTNIDTLLRMYYGI